MDRETYANQFSYGGLCRCCNKPNTPYMVRKDLWVEHTSDGVESKWIRRNCGHLQLKPGTGNMVCIACFEKRLGRDLTMEDFLPSKPPINFGVFGFDCRVYLSLPSQFKKAA